MRALSFFSRTLLLGAFLTATLPAMASGQRLENDLPDSPIKSILCAFDSPDSETPLWDKIGPLLSITLWNGAHDELTLPVKFVADFLNRCEVFSKEHSRDLVTRTIIEAIVNNFGKYLQLQGDGTYLYVGPPFFDEATEDNPLVTKSFEDVWAQIEGAFVEIDLTTWEQNEVLEADALSQEQIEKIIMANPSFSFTCQKSAI